MIDKENGLHELHQKLKKGFDLSFKRLLAQKRKNNGVFVFSKNGKIVEINAKDFKY